MRAVKDTILYEVRRNGASAVTCMTEASARRVYKFHSEEFPGNKWSIWKIQPQGGSPAKWLECVMESTKN